MNMHHIFPFKEDIGKLLDIQICWVMSLLFWIVETCDYQKSKHFGDTLQSIYKDSFKCTGIVSTPYYD